MEELEEVVAGIRPRLAAQDQARERALRACRQVIRHSSDAIRAVHRQEYDQGRKVLGSAEELVRELNAGLAGQGGCSTRASCTTPRRSSPRDASPWR